MEKQRQRVTCCRHLPQLLVSLLVALLLIPVLSAAQGNQVTGTVTDVSGGPLAGVSIRVQGKLAGTSTDANGLFQLIAEAGDVLSVSMVGYVLQEVEVTDTITYQIVLQEDSESLSEVVVTALGVKKEKVKLGYAVQEVQGSDLNKAREPNLVNSLTGKVAGLNIRNTTDLFQDPGISLRGRTPLIVIDGIPDQTADLWRINADDVESMNVLKGPTASALYGSIGQNGAIMITTKRGKGKAINLEVNSSTQFQTGFIRVPEVQTIYGNGNFGQYAYVDGSGGGTEGAGWIWGPKLDQPDPTTPSGYWETPQFNSPVDPNTGELVPLPFLSRGKDNIRNFFETGLISTNNVSLTQASERGSFRASASHIYQKGVVPNTDLNNTSFNVAGNYQLTERLLMDARISYNKEYTENFPVVGYGPTNYLYNLVLWTGPDIDVRDLRNYWREGQEGIQQRHYNISWYNNPYFQAYEYLQGYDKDNVFGSVSFDYRFTDQFSVSLRNGINEYGLRRNWKEPKSYVGYSSFSRGNYTERATSYFDIASDLILKYNQSFSDNFAIHAELGGYNYYRNIRQLESNTDGLNVAGFYNLDNSISPILATNSIEQRRTTSAYGFVDFELYNALYLTVTGRQDKVSTLPVQNNSYFYPSVAGSLALSRFLPLPEWTNFLKLRGSWARVTSGIILDASDNEDPYGFIASYDRGTIWNGRPAVNFGNVQINPNIKPQTSDTWEAGLEWRLLADRLSIDVAYFRSNDFNQIVRLPTPISSGYLERLENGNRYRREGWEFMVNATPVRGTFTWDMLLNLSTYRRTLTEIYGDEPYLDRLQVGDRADAIYTSMFETSPAGEVVYQSNGMPKSDPFSRLIGYRDPDLVYGFTNNFRFKDFSLGIQVDGRIGGSMFSETNQKMWWGGSHPGTVNPFREDANDGLSNYVGQGVVVTSGEITYDSYGNVTSDTRQFAPNTQEVSYIDYMTTTSNYAHTNYSYFSQTFLKLREVSLGWQLPRKWLNEIGFVSNVGVNIVGRNLLLFSKLPNVDPDSGRDNLQTPSTRNIGFNINVQF
ncbi:SusC/RagA family TonB-linked outer membrane protein [Parapedobacter koreensis]|uniref:TonB-linked outer membrane protein, SusC/RagA family n=1 Tax=Parapedobacter koreensis TaxID=332977 RepID=A0A1H7EW43_9SPHI|nr:SusC/RagA family TonB-linked outer membrane protein [Parapedobacter koreensis]SEK18113.1 TonB-linked outer membrane protein, SusC/RagA family [Parapedobacter koreensis]